MSDVNKEHIELNKQRREMFLDTLEKDATLFTDPKVGSLYLKALADSDKQAQTNLRLEVEDKVADSAAEQAQAITAISQNIATNATNPFRRVENDIVLERPTVKQSGKFEILESELAAKPTGQTHEQFTERRKAEEREKLANRS
jgi:hypothetical protein